MPRYLLVNFLELAYILQGTEEPFQDVSFVVQDPQLWRVRRACL